MAEKVAKKNSEIEQKLNLCKNVQWLYEHKKDDWKPFPLYINSLIECAYLKKEHIVNFNLFNTKISLINKKNIQFRLLLKMKKTKKVKSI